MSEDADVMRCVRGTLLCCLLTAGCNRAPGPTDTGAREAARGYYEAILGEDWARAYAALHADSRARCGPDPFARLGRQYRRGLGFEPKAVHVRSCEEHGREAIAHVVFTGEVQSRHRFHKDAITLRQGGNGWGVVLPPGFGQRRIRAATVREWCRPHRSLTRGSETGLGLTATRKRALEDPWTDPVPGRPLNECSLPSTTGSSWVRCCTL